MARKSFVELTNDLLTSFPDNVTGFITPEVLRDYLQNFLGAIRPSYALIQRTTPNTQALSTTPVPLIFETGLVSDVPDYTTDPTAGTITRLEAGTTTLLLTLTASGPNNAELHVVLYKDGVPTSWESQVTLNGSGKYRTIAVPALEYAGAQSAYQWFVHSDGPDNVEFTTLECIAETVPVNSY